MPDTPSTATIFAATGLAFASMALTSCSDDSEPNTASPVETIESQAAALRDGDCESAISLTVDNDPDVVADCESQIGDGLHIEVLNADITDQTNDSAQAHVTFSENGEKTERTITLRLVDNKWLID